MTVVCLFAKLINFLPLKKDVNLDGIHILTRLLIGKSDDVIYHDCPTAVKSSKIKKMKINRQSQNYLHI